MIPSNFKYGGTNPQISKGEIDVGESTIEAALREGVEELGLVKSNIKELFFVGDVNIVSNYETYTIDVYAAEVINENLFDQPHYETGKVLWLTAVDFEKVGRKNQNSIVQITYQKILSRI
jgi:8-oxo-dGTP pyrophosphatase MutT (NUDIX family)